MKVAVLGAGAIGALVAGYLALKGEEVCLVGHPDSVKAIAQKGLEIRGVRGNFNIKLNVSERLANPADLVILAVKVQDIEEALSDNLPGLKNSTLLTLQNGIHADNLVAKYIAKEQIISSIVMFGSTCLEPGELVHNFEGNWIIGKLFTGNDQQVIFVAELLEQAFPIVISDDIKGMKYLKIFINANNCIAAILGLSMQEAFSDLEVSSISIGIWKEGLEIVSKAGIKLTSLPNFPLERLEKLTALPTVEAAKIFSGIMSNLSKEPLYGSILQSIKRNRPSEIDYINGELKRLAQEYNLEASLNEKLIEMVHHVEKTNKFFSKKELLESVKGLVA